MCIVALDTVWACVWARRAGPGSASGPGARGSDITVQDQVHVTVQNKQTWNKEARTRPEADFALGPGAGYQVERSHTGLILATRPPGGCFSVSVCEGKCSPYCPELRYSMQLGSTGNLIRESPIYLYAEYTRAPTSTTTKHPPR